jgi:hypothetical protein
VGVAGYRNFCNSCERRPFRAAGQRRQGHCAARHDDRWRRGPLICSRLRDALTTTKQTADYRLDRAASALYELTGMSSATGTELKPVLQGEDAAAAAATRRNC